MFMCYLCGETSPVPILPCLMHPASAGSIPTTAESRSGAKTTVRKWQQLYVLGFALQCMQRLRLLLLGMSATYLCRSGVWVFKVRICWMYICIRTACHTYCIVDDRCPRSFPSSCTMCGLLLPQTCIPRYSLRFFVNRLPSTVHIFKRPTPPFPFPFCGPVPAFLGSLPIHIPQCQKKWVIEEEKKPKKERRPLPQPPKEIDEAISGGRQLSAAEIDKMNQDSYKQVRASCMSHNSMKSSRGRRQRCPEITALNATHTLRRLPWLTSLVWPQYENESLERCPHCGALADITLLS